MAHPALPRWFRALSWRLPLAATGGLGLAVLLAIIALGLGGLLNGFVTSERPGLGASLALVPAIGLLVATVVGMVVGTAAVASLTRTGLAGGRVRLRSANRETFRALPRLLALLLVGTVLLALTLVTWPLLSVAGLARAGWRARTRTTRATASQGMWLAIPFALPAAVLTELPLAFTCVLSGSSVRTAAAQAKGHTWKQRARTVPALAALVVASWGLGSLGMSPTLADLLAGTAFRTQGRFLTGVALSAGSTIVLNLATGGILGVLAHLHNGSPQAPPAPASVRRPCQERRDALGWLRSRLAATAVLVTSTLMVQLTVSVAVVTPAAAATTGDITVTTLADTGTAANGECVDADVPCGIRAAAARATALSADGSLVTIGFDVSGTVTLADTLVITAGTTVDGLDQHVTLDAHHDFRAIQVVMAGESEGGRATLRHVTVTGGRTQSAGAGLFSDNTRVVLDQVVFDDNVTGDGSGGGVAVPHGRLTVDRSTFSNNGAPNGAGGAVSTNDLVWTNSTSYNDTATPTQPYGGAINVDFRGTINHATVIGGGGIALSPAGVNIGGAVGVTNSLIDNTEGFGCANTTRTVDDDPATGGNVEPNGTCPGTRANGKPYGALTDNGGPTPTIALQLGSAALKAGLPDYCASSDQRGDARDPNSCDAGALQLVDAAQVEPVTVTVEAARGTQLTLGDPATFYAVLRSDAPIPAGHVQYYDGAAKLGAELTPGRDTQTAVLVTDTLRQGRHAISAQFVPDDDTANPFVADPIDIGVVAKTSLRIDATGPVRLHEEATITATLVPQADSDPKLRPTGQIMFQFGSGTPTSVDVVDGKATLVAEVTTSKLNAGYQGDANFSYAQVFEDVTTENATTTTVGELSAASVEYKSPLNVSVTVRDLVEPVTGTVDVLVDGTRTATEDLTDGRATFTVNNLTPGDHVVTLRSHPGAGWASSTSDALPVTVTPARSEVTVGRVETVAYGDSTEVTVAAGGVGRSAVQLIEGATVLDSKTIDLPGQTTFTVAGGAQVGAHTLTAKVVGSATTAASQSAPVTYQVTAARSSLIVTGMSAQPLGSTSSISVTSTPAALDGTLTATDGEGNVLGTGTLTDGAGVVTFTPRAAGLLELVVTFVPAAGSQYRGASVTSPMTIDKTVAAVPATSWNLKPTPGDTRISVKFPDSTPVSGTLQILTPRGMIAGTGQVLNGSGTVEFAGPAGVCYCDTQALTLVYLGDSRYAARSFMLPALDLPAHATTTTLSPLPLTVPRGPKLALRARVTSPTSPDLLTGTMVFTTVSSAGGRREEQVPMTADVGSVSLTPWNSGTYTVTASYQPALTENAPSTSTAASVEVLPYPMPTVKLVAQAPAGLPAAKIGQRLDIAVEAVTNSYWVIPGSRLDLRDSNGTLVGTGTWEPHGGGNSNQRATLAMVPEHGGPLTLTADFQYGAADDTFTGTSSPLTVDVTGVPAALTLKNVTAGQPTAGVPVYLEVGLPRTYEFGDVNKPVQFDLLANNVKVGGPYTLQAFEQSTRISVTPTSAGPVGYTVVSAPDGGDLASGRAYTLVDVAALVPQLDITSPGFLVNGQDYQPTISIGRGNINFGQALPTGTVNITVTPATGSSASCAVTLPATTCTVKASALAPGYGQRVTATYSGDPLYERFTRTGTLNLTQQASTVTADFSPAINDWVTGEPVTATWTTRVPDGTRPGGRVTVAVNGYQACQADAAANQCTFDAPRDPPLPQWAPYTVIITTFVPEDVSAGPSTDFDLGRPSRGCFAVTSATRLETQTVGGSYGSGPTIAGTASATRCTVGGVTGWVEGSQLTASFGPGQELGGYKMSAFALSSFFGADPFEQGSADGSVTFTVSGTTLFTAIVSYAPTCVAVALTTEQQAVPIPGWYPRPNQPAYDPGGIKTSSKPNCSSPGGVNPSAEELAMLAVGVGLFADGSTIAVQPVLKNGRYLDVDVPGATNTASPGMYSGTYLYPVKAPAAGARQSAFVGTDGSRHGVDQQVYVRYRLNDRTKCSTFGLFAGNGGSLSVTATDSTVDNANLFENASGACLNPDGARGLLAGTRVDLSANPRNDGSAQPRPAASEWFVNEWLDDTAAGFDKATFTTKLAPTAQGVRPDPAAYQPVKRSVTMPRNADARFGVSFAHIACVNVDVAVTVPDSAADNPGLNTPTNCPAVGVTTQKSGPTFERGSEQSQEHRVVTVTRHVPYLVGTKVAASADPTRKVAGYEYTSARGTVWPYVDVWTQGRADVTRTLAWTSSSRGVAAIGTTPAVPETEVTATNNLTFAGRYIPPGCRVPNVRVQPARLGVKINPGPCPDGQTGAPFASLTANPQPPLVPVWSTSAGVLPPPDTYRSEGWTNPNTDQYGETVQQGDTTFNYHDTDPRMSGNQTAQRVRLDYCARIRVSVTVVNAAGQQMNRGEETSQDSYRVWSGGRSFQVPAVADLLTEGARSYNCGPSMLMLPGESSEVKLNPRSSPAWTVVKWAKNGADVPTMTASVNSSGVVPDRYGVLVTPTCYQLTANARTFVNTPSNCQGSPAGENWYDPGTDVSLGFRNASDTFRGWEGVDGPASSEGNHVVMNRDRAVFSKWQGDSMDDFKASPLYGPANVLSSITQRAVSFLVTAATGIVMEFLSVASMAVTVLDLVCDGLSALGVPDSALAPVRNATAAAQAGLEAVQAWADCTNAWATGGPDSSGPPFSMNAYTDAPGAELGTDVALGELEKVGENGEGKQVTDKLGVAKDALDVALLFTTGMEAYSADAADSWSSAAGILTCVAGKVESAANAGQRAVGR